ncbi:MAG: helix-turn-helix transcriptional regulator [Bacillota bacterium]|nr:helix-turn-helix transcriptional regulator [Bacillota bacterium]
MNSDFSRIISLLRKESNKSQKQVAADLGVSQALLSHYEKGIRECGLDFVVNIADYYNVSCDYLLGRTLEKSGAKLSLSDIPETESMIANEKGHKLSNMLPLLNKKLLVNSIGVLYDILEKMGNKGITTEISNYLMVSVYKMFRTVYSANPKNPQGMFSIPETLHSCYANALLEISNANAQQIANGVSVGDFDGLEKEKAPELSPDVLSGNYSFLASSLYSLLQTTEVKIQQLVKK